MLQLRDKTANDRELIGQAKELLTIARQYGALLIVNDRIEVAQAAGADGVHLGQDDRSLAQARAILGPKAIVGRSTHSPEQALAAEREGFDYIGVGPVFATPTKPAYRPAGLRLVRFAAKNIRIPFVAIGGIDASNAGEVVKAGAKTVAVVRAMFGVADPKQAAERLIQIIRDEQ